MQGDGDSSWAARAATRLDMPVWEDHRSRGLEDSINQGTRDGRNTTRQGRRLRQHSGWSHYRAALEATASGGRAQAGDLKPPRLQESRRGLPQGLLRP